MELLTNCFTSAVRSAKLITRMSTSAEGKGEAEYKKRVFKASGALRDGYSDLYSKDGFKEEPIEVY